MPDRPIERRIQAPDGRTLAVAEWGDPSGFPVVAIHGTPGSRLGRWRDPSIYARAGIRRITFDRAGYGQSTRRPGRRVADIAEDVRTIADALGIERFAVTGRSGGGPHSLACAALLPERVIRCAAVVAVAPFDADGLDWFAGQTAGNVREGELSLVGEAALREQLDEDRRTILDRVASGAVDALPEAYQLTESDREQQRKDRAVFDEVMTDTLRDGVDGWVDDDLAFVTPWGFDVRIDRGPDVALVRALGHAGAGGPWRLAGGAHPDVEVFASDFGHFGEDADAARELDWLAGRQVASA